MTALLRGVADWAYGFLTPHRCRACGGALFDHENPYLCGPCLSEMRWIGAGACRGCGFPAGEGAAHRENCIRCRGGRLRLTGAGAVARYRGGAKSLIKSLKFRGETGLASVLGGMMADRFQELGFAGRVDCVIPVSLHGSRRRWRGFDQSVLLAREVARRTNLEILEGTLQRVRGTQPQAMLRRAERLRNMNGAFRASGDLVGKRILLVDDVLTTGATMGECARACREAGASRVYALVFAR